MRYAMLCRSSKETGGGWPDDENATVTASLDAAHLALADSARTLTRGHEPPMVVDGPFAETKEQFPGGLQSRRGALNGE